MVLDTALLLWQWTYAKCNAPSSGDFNEGFIALICDFLQDVQSVLLKMSVNRNVEKWGKIHT